jgi:hypothetical protein
MKKINRAMNIYIFLAGFIGLSISSVAQTPETLTQKQIDRTRTVYTEITINASPKVVRAKFLEFEKWPEWNTVIPYIAVISGDINDLATEPALELTLDFGRKKDPQMAPVKPKVVINNDMRFVWGLYNGFILKAEHVFIFEPTDNGKGTHLIHYEKMNGMLSPIFITKKVSANMYQSYNLMNESLKRICEQ